VRRYTLSRLAQEDLVAIRDYYLENGGARAARKVVTELVAAFRRLARNPGVGHPRADLAGDRPVLFWPVRNYLVVYRATGNRVEVVTVVHGYRDLAPYLDRLLH